METKFNFNSQICTSRSQSERLLALGLKKETADMVHFFSQSLAQDWTIVPLADGEVAKKVQGIEIPAWSLHRLIEMYVERYISCNMNLKDLTYERIINEIEIHIKEGYFNKEYLV